MNYLLLVLIGFLLGLFTAKVSLFVFLTTKVLAGLAIITVAIIAATIVRLKYSK